MALHRLFVLAKCELGRVEDVGAYIADNIHEVVEIYSITGEYDLLLKIPLRDVGEASDVVQAKLHQVPYLRETNTFMSFRVFGKDVGDFVT